MDGRPWRFRFQPRQRGTDLVMGERYMYTVEARTSCGIEEVAESTSGNSREWDSPSVDSNTSHNP